MRESNNRRKSTPFTLFAIDTRRNHPIPREIHPAWHPRKRIQDRYVRGALFCPHANGLAE